ncbi:MAG TPA: hypothetical protein VLS53_00200 [Candidatus Dormibacteraeota bacterium]|nr:hypothetical protein [Candidatus Dormibacteraeota bacterium]
MKAIAIAALALLVSATAQAQPVQVQGDKVVLVNDDKTFTVSIFASTARALPHPLESLPQEHEALAETKAKKDKQSHRVRITVTGCADEQGKITLHTEGNYTGALDWAASGSRMYDLMAVAVCKLAQQRAAQQ